jgi:hypothetical protein
MSLFRSYRLFAVSCHTIQIVTDLKIQIYIFIGRKKTHKKIKIRMSELTKPRSCTTEAESLVQFIDNQDLSKNFDVSLNP